jgi:predicted DNA-binding protein with PD1-like motif
VFLEIFPVRPDSQTCGNTYLAQPAHRHREGATHGGQEDQGFPGRKVYVIIFHAGDEALSGLVDFAVQNKIQDAHFTAIGAVRKATLGWLDLSQKAYRRIPVTEQSEVLSMIGDFAVFKGTPAIHTHVVLGGQSGKTVGGHVWELIVDPTLEVFVTVNNTPLEKERDNVSGLNLIDTKQ